LLAREGAKLVVVNRRADHAQALADEIVAAGGVAIGVAGDVTQARDCARIVDACAASYGCLDVLVNNVGTASRGTVVEVTEQEWDRTLRTNLTTVMLMSKYAVPQMATRGGTVINVSSMGAVRATAGGAAAYHAAKGGVIALTRSMACAHGEQGIRVNCVLPGPVFAAGVADNLTPHLRETRRRASPLGLEGDAWDVAWAIVYLASDEARWVTGTVLPVEGGILNFSPDNFAPMASRSVNSGDQGRHETRSLG